MEEKRGKKQMTYNSIPESVWLGATSKALELSRNLIHLSFLLTSPLKKSKLQCTMKRTYWLFKLRQLVDASSCILNHVMWTVNSHAIKRHQNVCKRCYNKFCIKLNERSSGPSSSWWSKEYLNKRRQMLKE